MDLMIFFAAAVVAIVNLYLLRRFLRKFVAFTFEGSRRIAARQAHITPLVPKYQIALAVVAFVIVALEFMYLLIGFRLPKMEIRVALAVVGATSFAYLLWYSFRWRA